MQSKNNNLTIHKITDLNSKINFESTLNLKTKIFINLEKLQYSRNSITHAVEY